MSRQITFTGTDNEITFTTLRELRDWLIDLDQKDLDGPMGEADWFTAYVTTGQNRHYFHIQPHTAGEE